MARSRAHTRRTLRAHATLVGRYEVAEPFGVVVPCDPRIPCDIFTMRADAPDVPDGALVRVRIGTYPGRNTAATGVVEEVLGRADDERAGIDVIVARHKLETAFSEGALSEARAAVLDECAALASGYRDLRDRYVFTIDPADARDFDDALSVEYVGLPADILNTLTDVGQRVLSTRSKEESAQVFLWRVGVHIADVSHYVPWDCSLDLEARRRATSVYLVDRVIPMLPHELSSDLCSLRPGEVRRTMTVDLYMDDAGEVAGYEIYPALIRSDARLTYDEAQNMLEGATAPSDAAPAASAVAASDMPADESPLPWRLAALSRLAKLRAARRKRAGGLDFDTVEAKVRLDSEGAPVAIDLRRKTDATQLVEEAMILANETVARHLSEHEFPAIYRVHEKPAPESLAALIPVLGEFPWFTEGVAARLATGDPHAVQDVLAASAERPEGELVSTLLLRSMKRAVYRSENDGHYGLACRAYLHFTSPIRRYPDLVVHRMLKAQLVRRPQKFDQEVASLRWIAEHSSDNERVADAAARESQEFKIIEYLECDVGKSFSAVVSGVANCGIWARLANTAEGFLPVRTLGSEYFALDPARHTLTGHDTGTVFRLGQRIPVTITAADPRTRTLDFRLATR